MGVFVTILLNKPKQLQQLVSIQEKMIFDNEIKFKTIFDRAPVGIALVDANTGGFLEINSKFCELIGYSEEEMKTKDYQSITHPKDLLSNELVATELQEGKISEYKLKKRYITKFGKIIWTNLIVTSLSKANKKLNTNISIVEDITLQHQILEDLKKNEKQFKSLFKSSPIPLWEVDLSLVKNYLRDLNLINKSSIKVTSYFEQKPLKVKTHLVFKN